MTNVLCRVVLVATIFASPDIASAQSAPRPRVVMISIDGLSPDYVLDADRYGLKIPTLRRLVAEGSYATAVRGVLPTVTYPSHATLLTGVSPAAHGVTANLTFDPLVQNDNGWYWYAGDIRVPTLWDAARQAGLRTANVHWPVSVGANITYNLPQYWRKGTADDRKLLRHLATPGLVDRLEKLLGPYADGIDETIEGDENRGRFTARLLEVERPDFITAYYTALDHEQHATGPHSRESHATLERIDAIIGSVVNAAQRLSGGRTVIALVSDHGHVSADMDLAPLTEFRRQGWLKFKGDSAPSPESWDATLWSSTGTAAVMLRDAADTALVRRTGEVVKRIASDTANGVARVMDAREASTMNGFRGAAWVMVMRPGYRISSATTGPLLRKGHHGGTHGYSPDVPGMNASFFVTGPGVAKGRSLGAMDMRDIAPTIAGLLRVSLPGVEGIAKVTPASK